MITIRTTPTAAELALTRRMPTIPEAIRAGLTMRDELREAMTIYRQWGHQADEAMTVRLAMRLGYGRSPRDAAHREHAYTMARTMAAHCHGL